MTDHQARVQYESELPDYIEAASFTRGRISRAICACGWVGPWQAYDWWSETDARQHEEGA